MKDLLKKRKGLQDIGDQIERKLPEGSIEKMMMKKLNQENKKIFKELFEIIDDYKKTVDEIIDSSFDDQDHLS